MKYYEDNRMPMRKIVYFFTIHPSIMTEDYTRVE